MNKRSEIIINELLKQGLITKMEDVTADDKTNIIFDYMIKNYANLLSNDLTESQFSYKVNNEDIFHKIIMKYGKYFLRNPQIIENRDHIINNNIDMFPISNYHVLNEISDNEPVIFVTNHGFKDDVLATLLAAKKRTYVMLGSLPQFYGTLDGLLSQKNGVILVNRKIKESKSSSVEKAKKLLENGTSLMICPEGVWNKTANMPLIDFWSGFYRIAKKEDGTFYKIIPIIHYIDDTYKKGQENPIHTIIDYPIDLSGIEKDEATDLLRTRMLTWYWKLMELYGTKTREELLKGYNNSLEAWREELKKRVSTASKYDLEIEISADKYFKETDEKVWGPIANININQHNINDKLYAINKVQEFENNDFQHKF